MSFANPFFVTKQPLNVFHNEHVKAIIPDLRLMTATTNSHIFSIFYSTSANTMRRTIKLFTTATPSLYVADLLCKNHLI